MGQSIQEWTKKNLWKTAFKNFGGMYLVHSLVLCPIYSLTIELFQTVLNKNRLALYSCGRQPLKNFTWSILEHFVPNNTECNANQ